MTRGAEICWTFQYLAWRTWESLCVGPGKGIEIGEESLTDFNLLDVQIRFPANIKLYKYTKTQEHDETGADWEWWIGSSASDTWRRIRVQAKKLFHKGSQYKYDAFNESQMRLLIDKSLDPAVSAVPLYCFYNYWHDTSVRVPRTSHCLNHHCPARCYDMALFPGVQGCTIAAAERVSLLPQRSRKTLRDVSNTSSPWHCLVCPGLLPTRPVVDTVDVALMKLLGVTNLPRRWVGLPDYARGILPQIIGVCFMCVKSLLRRRARVVRRDRAPRRGGRVG